MKREQVAEFLADRIHIRGEGHDMENFRGCTHPDCITARKIVNIFPVVEEKKSLKVMIRETLGFMKFRWTYLYITTRSTVQLYIGNSDVDVPTFLEFGDGTMIEFETHDVTMELQATRQEEE